MINLMPPELQSQIRFAKMNRMVLGYLKVTIVVVVVLAGVFGAALYMPKIDGFPGGLVTQTTAVAADVTSKENEIASIQKSFLPKAKTASDRLNAIKYVQTTQSKFSSVISDLSKVIPQGVSIDTMTLTGDPATPMQVVVSAVTNDQVLALRNALITSPRISGADIVTISAQDTPGNSTTYHLKATLSVSFKPGQAK